MVKLGFRKLKYSGAQNKVIELGRSTLGGVMPDVCVAVMILVSITAVIIFIRLSAVSFFFLVC